MARQHRVCPYCGNTDTKKDGYGYCIRYGCFQNSGLKKKIDSWKVRAWRYLDIDPRACGMVSGPVSNPYNKRERFAQSLVQSVKHDIGFVPTEVSSILSGYLARPWDRNVRW